MVNVNDCGCPCEDNGKKKQIEERALSSINKIYTTEGATYFPDGTGMVTLPIPTTEQMQAIASVPEMASDIKQLKISDAEHTEAIATIESNVDTHAREILQLTNSDDKQNTEIKGITESLISDVDAVFNNTTRDLRIVVEREKASAIEAVVNIPATSQTGTYAPSAPITISPDNQVGLAIDSSLAVKNGVLSVNTQGSVKVDGETIIKDADDVLEVNTAKIAPITYVDSKIKTATAATGKAFGSMGITADASGVDITMTGIDEATSVTGRIPVCTEDKAGLMTPADRIKIDGIKGEAYLWMTPVSHILANDSNDPTDSDLSTITLSGDYTFKTVDISTGECRYRYYPFSKTTPTRTNYFTTLAGADTIEIVNKMFHISGGSSGTIKIWGYFANSDPLAGPVKVYGNQPDTSTFAFDVATQKLKSDISNAFIDIYTSTSSTLKAGTTVTIYPIISKISYIE